jgi:hypothetical protein
MFDVPDAVGVPEMTPEDVFKASPAGRVPLVRLHVMPPVPPVEVSVAR